jgi:hypothetical protein
MCNTYMPMNISNYAISLFEFLFGHVILMCQ